MYFSNANFMLPVTITYYNIILIILMLPVVEASVKTLFRASAGCNENLYNLWTGNSITPQVTDSFSPALISTSSSDSGVYKSPIIKCNTFSSMKEVRHYIIQVHYRWEPLQIYYFLLSSLCQKLWYTLVVSITHSLK